MDVFESQCSSPDFYNRRILPDINTANPPTFRAPGKEDRSDLAPGREWHSFIRQVDAIFGNASCGENWPDQHSRCQRGYGRIGSIVNRTRYFGCLGKVLPFGQNVG